MIYISHRLDEIRRLGDRVTVLTDGRTVASGLPATTPAEQLVERMVGRKVGQLYPRAAAPGTARSSWKSRGSDGCPDVKHRASRSAQVRCSGSVGWSAPGAASCLRAIYGVDDRDRR